MDRASDRARHDALVALVDRMLEAKRRFLASKTEAVRNRLEIEIESLDRQIDDAVYELYALTEDEIKIIEEKA